MKTFKSIQEERGERAYKQAIQMGLKYGGFGYWKDPQTNETVYKTENDTLVPVEKDVESELAAKGGPEGGAGRPDPMAGGPGGAGGGMANAAGMLQMPGGGQGMAGQGILGTPEPGAEKAPKEQGWEPGPDGDTCVGPEAEEPGKVPEDSYVGRTNFMKWGAGPDGDNMTTVSYKDIEENVIFLEGGKTDLGSDYVPLNTQQRNAIQQRQNLAAIEAQKRKKANKVFDGSGEIDNPGKGTIKALNRRRKKNTQAPENYQRGLGKMKKAGLAGSTMPGEWRDSSGVRRNYTGSDSFGMEDDYEEDMGRRLSDIQMRATQGPKDRDKQRVNKMNEEMKDFFKDPDYDLEQFEKSDFIASGAFGKTFVDKNDNIVKQGKLGPGEMSALYAMRDNPAFPDLINGRLDSPFIHQMAAYNNPDDDPDMARSEVDSMMGTNLNYWDPSKESDFMKHYPVAFGTYAMSKAKGSPLYESWSSLDEETKDKAIRNFWRARGDLHKAGFSHNDMHGGNVMVDPETGEVSILDLGLAKENKISAFMEALGGLDFEEGNDYQLAHQLSGSSFSERMQNMSVKNREAVEEMIMDSFEEGEMEDEDSFYEKIGPIRDMMVGDIRMESNDFQRLIDAVPALQNDEFVDKLIKTLYNEIGNSELADRMSDAFDERQKDTKVIAAADKIRAARGEKPLSVRNKSVIPPKNMDFDD